MELLLRLVGTGSLAALLAGAIAFAVERDVEVERNTVQNALEDHESLAQPIRSPSTQERSDIYYQAILDRPVFEITRRPIEPQAEAPEPEPEIIVEMPAPAPELPKVSLLGVMSTGSRIQALIAVEGGEALWLTEGEKIGGWTITGAGKDWLELAAEDNKVRLELFE